jgi:hypothetical protein
MQIRLQSEYLSTAIQVLFVPYKFCSVKGLIIMELIKKKQNTDMNSQKNKSIRWLIQKQSQVLLYTGINAKKAVVKYASYKEIHPKNIVLSFLSFKI